MGGIGRHRVDACVGLVNASQFRAFTGGSAMVRCGDAVDPHGIGKHAYAHMAECSPRFFVGGIGVCRTGDLADCGDPLVPGSARAFIE